MAKSKSQRMKEYRERKKALMGDEWLKKKSQRTKQYYVPVEMLGKKKANARREQIRKNVQTFRKRKENDGMLVTVTDDENGVSSTVDVQSQSLIVKLPTSCLPSRSTSGKKRVSHALSRANKKIKDLRTENKNLMRNLNASRKRLERERKKNCVITNETTPRSKTNNLLRSAGVSPSTSNGKVLAKKLLCAECLSSESKQSHAENPQKKKIVATVASGNILKKYRQQSMLKKTTNINARRHNIRSKTITTSIRRRSVEITQRIKRAVAHFLSRDDNSRMMPGKVDALKEKGGKGKIQKRVLNDYLHNLHLKFSAENTYKISLATFCRYRPKHITLVNYAFRNTCLCQKHQNFALKLKCLKSLGITTCTSPDNFVTNNREKGIDEDLNKITAARVTFKHWKRVKMPDGKERVREVELKLPKEDFQNLMRETFIEFIEHVDKVKNQYSVVRQMKENLPKTHALVQMDFAENYSCQSLDEVQSAYWNCSMVTLHPTHITRQMMIHYNITAQ